MKITNMSREFNAKEIYNMTQDKAVISTKDVADNEILNVNGYITFEDTNKDGDTSDILAIMGADADGVVKVWACQSATFKRSFFDIIDILNSQNIDIAENAVAIQKLSGTTKAGREYVDCRWA